MENELVMPFINQSRTFVLGFECGQIWEKIEAGEVIDYQPVHRVNVEQIKMIGETLGAVIEIADGDETWSFLTVRSAIHGI